MSSGRWRRVAWVAAVAGAVGLTGACSGEPAASSSGRPVASALVSAVPLPPDALVDQIMAVTTEATAAQAAQLQGWGDQAVAVLRSRLAEFSVDKVLATVASSELAAGRPGDNPQDAITQIVAPVREAFGPYARVARAMSPEQVAAVGQISTAWGSLIPVLLYLDGPEAATEDPAAAVAAAAPPLLANHPEVGVPFGFVTFTTAVGRDAAAAEPNPAAVGRVYANAIGTYMAGASGDQAWLTWIGGALIGNASSTPWAAMEPVILLCAYRFGDEDCRDQVEGHTKLDSVPRSVYAQAMGARYDVWTGENGVEPGSASLVVPPTVGAGGLPELPETVESGAEAPAEGTWIIARRDGKEDPNVAVFWQDALAGLYGLGASLDSLAYDATTLSTVILVSDQWTDVTSDYVVEDMEIYRCSTTVFAINVAEGKSYKVYGPYNGQSPPQSLEVPKDTTKFYLDCVSDDTLFEKIAPLLEELP